MTAAEMRAARVAVVAAARALLDAAEMAVQAHDLAVEEAYSRTCTEDSVKEADLFADSCDLKAAAKAGDAYFLSHRNARPGEPVMAPTEPA